MESMKFTVEVRRLLARMPQIDIIIPIRTLWGLENEKFLALERENVQRLWFRSDAQTVLYQSFPFAGI